MALIAVSGHLKDVSGANIAGSVVFQLVNYGAAIPRVIGTNALVPTNVTFTAAANGAWSGNIQSNDSIDPGASNTPPTTYYTVQFRDANGAEIQTVAFNFTGAGPSNLDSQAPLVTIPLPTAPPNTAGLLAANQTWTGVNTFTGANVISAKNIDNIRIAAQFAGSDFVAKINAADTDLGAASGEIWVDTSAGTSASTALTLSSNHVLRFINGSTYTSSVGWTITNQNNYSLAGLPGKLTTLSFTGSAGLVMDGSGLTNGTFGAKITDLTFSGNSGITNVVTFKNIHRSIFDFSARNCSGVAIVLNGCLLNTGRLVVSSNEGTFTNVPTGGVLLDHTVSPAVTCSNNDFFYVIEGVSANGIEIKFGNNNIVRGTSEGNGRGLQIDAGGNTTTCIGLDCESNSTEDVLFNGTNLTIIEGTSSSTNRVHVGSTGSNCWIIGPGNGSAAYLATTIDGGGGGFISADPISMDSASGHYVVDHGVQTLTSKTLTGASSGNNVTLLNIQGTSGALTGNAADQTFFTYTLPASTLQVGKAIRVTALFFHNSGTANPVYKLFFGATAITTFTSTEAATSRGKMEGIIYSTGAAAQLATNGFMEGPTSTSTVDKIAVPTVATPAETQSGAIVIKATFNVAATDQVTPQFWLVELVQ